MTTSKSDKHVKVLFEVTGEDGTSEVESVWAVPVHGGHRLDNIPFYARGWALGDIVATTPDPDGLLRVTGLVSESGHSTLRLWFADAGDVQGVRDGLRGLGCASELDLSRLVAVDVPPDVPLAKVRIYLDPMEGHGVFELEEGCLAQ